MKKYLSFFTNVSLFLPFFFSTEFLELHQYQQGDEGLFGCGVCGLFTGVAILIPILLLVINIALLVWVARDAKNRGMDNPALWMILVFFLGFIGLIIYLLSRSSGILVTCENCTNRKLEIMKTCPHCGHKTE